MIRRVTTFGEGGETYIVGEEAKPSHSYRLSMPKVTKILFGHDPSFPCGSSYGIYVEGEARPWRSLNPQHVQSIEYFELKGIEKQRAPVTAGQSPFDSSDDDLPF